MSPAGAFTDKHAGGLRNCRGTKRAKLLLLLFFGLLARHQRLYHFGQIRKRLLIFLVKRLRVLAARIGLLQRADHGTRDWYRSASVVLFADQVKLLSRLLVAREAVQAEAVVYVLKTALIDFAAVLAHINRKEFPVAGRGIESLLLFDHDLGRDQLYDRTFRVITGTSRQRRQCPA